MKILLCHTHYQQPGGEDESFAAEARLLESRGHEVIRYTRHNSELEAMSRMKSAATAFWNRSAAREVQAIVRRERPQVMHCTNTFPLLSPSIYYAARKAGVPVVQSLRNYRQLCPSALFLRNNRVCEDCLGKRFAWAGVRHACYRESRLASAVVAGMSSLHQLLGTWHRAVDMYFTPSEFARGRFLAAGWPAEKIRVKPNFIDPDPNRGLGSGNYAVFVGRLSEEKGIDTLLAAWQQLPIRIPLKIVGQGPLEDRVRQFAAAHNEIEVLGRLPLAEVLEVVGEARFLVMPSLWYETFGRTIVEAFAKATPVIVSDLGAMAELVEHEQTGLRFPAGDTAALAQCMQRLIGDEPLRQKMRQAARSEYLARYRADENHDLLLDIYHSAMKLRGIIFEKPVAAAT